MSTPPTQGHGGETLERRSARFRTGALMRVLGGDTARKGYLAGIDQGIISLTNFLASVYLARLVSPTEFGVYAVGFLLLHFARAFQEGMLVQPLNGQGAVMPIEAFRKYVSSSWILQLLIALLFAAGAAAGGWLLTALGNDVAGPTLFSLWFLFLTWQPQEFLRRTFYARGRIYSAILNTTLASVVRLLSLYLFGRFGQLSGRAGLHAIGWGALIAALVGIWQARPYWTRSFKKLHETSMMNWELGRWVLGGTIANWFALEVYPILAAGLISFAAAGAYRALLTVVAPVHVLLRAMDTLLTPRAALVYHRSGRKALTRTLRLTYLISGVPILGLLIIAVLFPGQILYLFYGETYLPYQQGLIWAALFYVLWYAYWPLQSALKGIQKTFAIFTGNVIAILSMFSVGLWAIHRWGLYGTLAGQALNALIVGCVLWTTWFFRMGDREGQIPVKS
jgi:O-antigen/teichoic acid export membrane protein